MNDAALLDLWEAAWPLAPSPRAQLLARAGGAADDAGPGQRNDAVLRLRSQICGPALRLRACCPGCATDLEFEIDSGALPAPGSSTHDAVHELQHGPIRVRFRAPRTDDLDAVAAPGRTDDTFAAARALFERCIVDARVDGRAIDAAELGADVRQAVADALDAADPLASLAFDLACPACATRFDAPLDLAGVTFAELRHRAEGVLADVATLAQAYGWREHEVLALTPLRRAAYLQLAGADG